MCKFQTPFNYRDDVVSYHFHNLQLRLPLRSSMKCFLIGYNVSKKTLNRVHKSWQKWELQFMDVGRTRPFCSERWRLALALCQLSQRHRYLKLLLNWHLGIDASASVIKLKSQILFFVPLARP